MGGPVEVLDYWLGELGPEDWYAGGEALDAAIRDRWAEVWQAAHDGHLAHWVDGAAGCLAFLIVADQFPRNIHRGTALAFATDPMAREAARAALAAGWDMEVPEPERQFMYLPFEHSEEPADQDLSVRLFEERMPDAADNILHARAHAAVIRRFGRFPYRNAALGRESTAREETFLAAGGYMSVVRELGG